MCCSLSTFQLGRPHPPDHLCSSNDFSGAHFCRKSARFMQKLYWSSIAVTHSLVFKPASPTMMMMIIMSLALHWNTSSYRLEPSRSTLAASAKGKPLLQPEDCFPEWAPDVWPRPRIGINPMQCNAMQCLDRRNHWLHIAGTTLMFTPCLYLLGEWNALIWYPQLYNYCHDEMYEMVFVLRINRNNCLVFGFMRWNSMTVIYVLCVLYVAEVREHRQRWGKEDRRRFLRTVQGRPTCVFFEPGSPL